MFIKKLKKIFDVPLNNYWEHEPGRCIAYISLDTFDKDNEDFKQLMDKYKVFIAETDEFDAQMVQYKYILKQNTQKM